MPLYAHDTKSGQLKLTLSPQELASIYYHDIFEYPMTMKEISKWTAGSKVDTKRAEKKIRTVGLANKSGYFFMGGREKMVLKRIMNNQASKAKLELATHAAFVLERIPTIKGVFLTGSLAMKNANSASDIDLLIII